MLNQITSSVTDEWLFATAAVTVVLECGWRFCLLFFVAPATGVLWGPALSVIWPPFFAVCAAGGVMAVRSNGGADGVHHLVRNRLPGLVAVAVVGHVFALVVGTALFVLIDTPIRYVVYWAGRGELISPWIIVFSPPIGVGLGALVGWSLPAITVISVAGGARVREAIQETRTRAVASPRAVARLVAWQFVFGGILVLSAFGVSRWLDRIHDSLRTGSPEPSIALAFAVGGLVVVFGSAVCSGGLFELTRSVLQTNVAERQSASSPPLVRFGLIFLVCTGLVVAAGVVRINETRPTETSPEPLPDDPDALYATALENTHQSNHKAGVTFLENTHQSNHKDNYTDKNGTEQFYAEIRLDRDDRQMKIWSAVPEADKPEAMLYGTTGQAYKYTSDNILTSEASSEQSTIPLYLVFIDSHTTDNNIHFPDAEAKNWTKRSEYDGTIVLELADATTIRPSLPDYPGGDFIIRQSQARATVDTDSKTITEMEVLVWAVKEPPGDNDARTTIDNEEIEPGPAEIYFHRRYEFETDIDVERPAEVGSPTFTELLWRLFAY